jgi:RNA binding exosome subunit
MKLAHQIKAKVFSYEKFNEDDKLVLDKFLRLFPFSLKDEKIELEKINASGLNENRITIFEATLEKEKHTSRFLENLAGILDQEQKSLILSQLESRLDDNLDFYLRFDKKEYIKNNKLVLTDSGNCFHIKISVAAFPKKREIGLEIVKKVFG